MLWKAKVAHYQTFTTIHNFTGASADGFSPYSPLVRSGKVLYGTTLSGGAYNSGAVFSLAPPTSPGEHWTEKILYSFTGGLDGAGPEAGLVIVGEVLYGATNRGGAANLGTAYSLTPPQSPGGPWTETVLHSFGKEKFDGTTRRPPWSSDRVARFTEPLRAVVVTMAELFSNSAPQNRPEECGQNRSWTPSSTVPGPLASPSTSFPASSTALSPPADRKPRAAFSRSHLPPSPAPPGPKARSTASPVTATAVSPTRSCSPQAVSFTAPAMVCTVTARPSRWLPPPSPAPPGSSPSCTSSKTPRTVAIVFRRARFSAL